MHRGEEVQLDRLAECLAGLMAERSRRRAARVAEENVETAELAVDALHEALGLGRHADVGQTVLPFVADVGVPATNGSTVWPASEVSCVAARSTASSCRPFTATRAPSCASTFATARPSPWVLPHTRATRRARPRSIGGVIYGCQVSGVRCRV